VTPISNSANDLLPFLTAAMPPMPVATGTPEAAAEGEGLSWQLLWMGEAEGLEAEMTAATEEEEAAAPVTRAVAEPAVVWLNSLPQVSFVPAPVVTETDAAEAPVEMGEAVQLGTEELKGEMRVHPDGEAAEAPAVERVELAAEDKGEVIWSADLVVRESGEGETVRQEAPEARAAAEADRPAERTVEAAEVRKATPAEAETARVAEQAPAAEAPARDPVRTEQVRTEPAVTEVRPRAAVSEERPAADKPAKRVDADLPARDIEPVETAEAAPVANGRETAGREQEGRDDGQREDHGERSEKREAGRQEQPIRKTERASVAELETPAAVLTEPAARTEGATEGAASKPLSIEMAGVQAAEGPKPLRPAQVATLQMDVRPTDAAEDAAPVRLVVSQRGDQVSVRVRSWDATAAPLSEEQMRPLVESLAGQGYQKRSVEGTRMEDAMPAAIERTAERMEAQQGNLTGGGEQQTQHGAEDRQQQQRERQQQQAENLRRNLRREPAGEFNLAELTAETGEGRK
jgi:hypothetical protein